MPRSAAELVREYKQIYELADSENRDLTAAFTDPSRNSSTGGPGDVFIRSEGYKAIKASDMRPQQWSSGPVEVMGPPALQAKGTLLETGAGGPGGGLILPYYQPGVVPSCSSRSAWPTFSASRRRLARR